MASKRAIKAQKHECVSEKCGSVGWRHKARDSVRFVTLRVSTSLRTCLPSQQFHKHTERLLPHSFWVSTSDKHTERLSYLWVWSVNLAWIFSPASSWFRTRTNSELVLNVWVYAVKKQGILLRRGVPISFEIFPFNHWNLTRPSHIDFSHQWITILNLRLGRRGFAEPSEAITPTPWLNTA